MFYLLETQFFFSKENTPFRGPFSHCLQFNQLYGYLFLRNFPHLQLNYISHTEERETRLFIGSFTFPQTRRDGVLFLPFVSAHIHTRKVHSFCVIYRRENVCV